MEMENLHDWNDHKRRVWYYCLVGWSDNVHNESAYYHHTPLANCPSQYFFSVGEIMITNFAFTNTCKFNTSIQKNQTEVKMPVTKEYLTCLSGTKIFPYAYSVLLLINRISGKLTATIVNLINSSERDN